MTKEELEKEAEEYASENDICVCGDEYWSHNDIKQAYLASAEPREKRIAELEEKLAISEHDREHNDYELTEVYKKVKQLEARIEGMKLDIKFDLEDIVPYTVLKNILVKWG